MDFRWPPPPDGRPDRYRPPVTRGPQTPRPTLPMPPTELVATPHGVELERLILGEGRPSTVFAHGLGGSMTDTRMLGAGVLGRKIYFHFRGHGRSAVPLGRWGYLDLARDLRAIADLTGATRAVGAGLGAGALCRLLADHPTRFDRVVFFLPSAFAQARPPEAQVRITSLVEAVEAADPAGIAELISQEIPQYARQSPAVWTYLRQRLDQLIRDGLAPGLVDLAAQAPVVRPAALAEVDTPALVLGCAGDELHPVEAAEQLAEALPYATLHIYDRPGVFWTNRSDLRQRVSQFLND